MFAWKTEFYCRFCPQSFYPVQKKNKTKNTICNFSLETWKLKKRKKKFSFYKQAFTVEENLAQEGRIQMMMCGNSGC